MEVRRESLDAVAPGLFRMHFRGARVWLTFLNAGARIERWRRLNTAGEWIDLCLFYPNPADALSDQVSMGVTVGRFANRIDNGQFIMNGQAIQLERNESGKHHLHGGTHGFGQRLWRLKNMGLRDATFALHSPHGDQGYPGSVDMEVRYVLDTEDQLRIVHSATCDRETIINTTNHAYFNLHGVSLKPGASSVPDIMDHQLQIIADQYLHDRGDFIPSGAMREVENTPFDFRAAHTLSGQVPRLPKGLLNTTYINPQRDPAQTFAHVSAPGSPWTLSVGSDAPGAILYNGFSLSKEQTFGLYDAMSGLCIEPQNYPDCVNHPDWPSSVTSPSQPYSRTIIYRLQENE